jgi:hypothetical protein
MYKSEEEVLLLPMFTYQVTDVYTSSSKKELHYKDENDKPQKYVAKVTEITLAELPYSDILKYK